MEQLPAELLAHICSFLERSVLADFALTAKSYLVHARWQLYTAVVLRSDRLYSSETFRLLLDNPQLAKRTISLAIETDPEWDANDYVPADDTTWIEPSIFKLMGGLRRLRFRRSPCMSRRDGNMVNFLDILNIVYEHCTNLTELTIMDLEWSPASEPDSQALTGSIRAKRPPLQKVVYSPLPSNGIDWTLVFCSLFSPTTTIAHLDLSVGAKTGDFSVLGTLFFPSLLTLYLRDIPAQGTPHMGRFLAAHRTIKHLFLIDVFPFTPTTATGLGILPQLVSIQAQPVVLTRLSAGCERLRQVSVLILDFAGVVEVVRETAEMLHFIGGFPELLRCSIMQVISVEIVDVIKLIAQDSNQLTYWTGGFYCHEVWEVTKISRALAAFPDLKRIDICEWTYSTTTPTRKQISKGLTGLAHENTNLRLICLYMDRLPTNEIVRVYNVRHYPRAFVRQVYACTEGGPNVPKRRCVDLAEVSPDMIALSDW